jgi:hypothetical protein
MHGEKAIAKVRRTVGGHVCAGPLLLPCKCMIALSIRQSAQ